MDQVRCVPMVSVIILLDGKSRHNAPALDGILAQGNALREVLLIPVGEDESLPEYARELVRGREKVLVLDPCGDIAQAINLGISEAAGEYVHFCTGREIPDPGAYGTIVEQMARNQADAACFGWRDHTGASMCGSGFRGTGNMQAFLEMILTDPGAEGDYSGYGGQLWNKMFRRHILYIEGSRIFAEPEGAGLLETLWQCRVSLQCQRAVFLPDPMVKRLVPGVERLEPGYLDLPALIRKEQEAFAQAEAISTLAYRRMQQLFFAHLVRLLLVCREQKLVKMAAAIENHMLELGAASWDEGRFVQLAIREEYQRRTIGALKQENGEQNKQIQQLSKRAEGLVADRTFLQNKTERQARKIEGLEVDRDFLKKKTEGKTRKIEGLEEDRRFLKNKAERQQQKIESLSQDVAFLKAKRAELETALGEYQGSFLARTGLKITRLYRKILRKFRSWIGR